LVFGILKERLRTVGVGIDKDARVHDSTRNQVDHFCNDVAMASCFETEKPIIAYVLVPCPAEDKHDGENDVVIKWKDEVTIQEDKLRFPNVLSRQTTAFQDEEGTSYCCLVAIEEGVLRNAMSELLEEIEIFQSAKLQGMPKSKVLLELVLNFPSVLAGDMDYCPLHEKLIQKNRDYYVNYLKKRLEAFKTNEERKELEETIALAKINPGKAQDFCLNGLLKIHPEVNFEKQSQRSSRRLAGAEPEVGMLELGNKSKKSDYKTNSTSSNQYEKKSNRSSVRLAGAESEMQLLDFKKKVTKCGHNTTMTESDVNEQLEDPPKEGNTMSTGTTGHNVDFVMATGFGNKNPIAAYVLVRADDLEVGEKEVVIKSKHQIAWLEDISEDANVVARQKAVFEDEEGRIYYGIVAIETGVLGTTTSQLLDQIENYQLEKLQGKSQFKMVLELVLHFKSVLSPEQTYTPVPQDEIDQNRNYFISCLDKDLENANTTKDKIHIIQKIESAREDPGQAQPFCLTNEKPPVIKVKILKRSQTGTLRLAGPETEASVSSLGGKSLAVETSCNEAKVPKQSAVTEELTETTPTLSHGQHVGMVAHQVTSSPTQSQSKKKPKKKIDKMKIRQRRSLVKRNKFKAKLATQPGSLNVLKRKKMNEGEKELHAKKMKKEAPANEVDYVDEKEDFNFTCVSDNDDSDDQEIEDYGCWTENAVLAYRNHRRRIVNVEKGIAAIMNILSKQENERRIPQEDGQVIKYQMSDKETDTVKSLIAVYFPLETEEEVTKLFKERTDLTTLLKKYYVNTSSLRPIYLFPGKVMNQIFHPDYMKHHMYSTVTDGTELSSRSSWTEGQVQRKKKISEHFKTWFSELCSETVEKLYEYDKKRFIATVSKVPNSNLRAGDKRRNKHAVRSILQLGDSEMP